MTTQTRVPRSHRPIRAAVTPILAALALGVALLAPLGAQAQGARAAAVPAGEEKPIVADLSKHLVAITTGFAGTDVLLFGATDGPGDVVLVVRGPAHEETVRRKDRMGIIWANKSAVTFSNAPAFYYVASNNPAEDILPQPVLERHQILARNLDLRVEGLTEDESRVAFREALERLKTGRGLYGYDPGGVNLLGNRLFRAELNFPANVPTGTYMVEVYLVRDGDVVSAEITPLIISKVGVGADVFHFAHNQSALYGIAAIIIAVFAGWLAGVAFRKG